MEAGVFSRNKGIFIILVTLCLIELLARTGIRIPNPPPILMLTIIIAVYLGGVNQGLISAAITWLYAIYYFSIPGQLFHYTNESLLRVIVLTFVIPATAMLVGALKRRADSAFNLEKDKAVLQTEIEERKKAEDALILSQKRLQDRLDNSTDLIYMPDTEGRVILFNSRLERLLGVKREEIMGKLLTWKCMEL